jgi:hypothetical protein
VWLYGWETVRKGCCESSVAWVKLRFVFGSMVYVR